jgi:hypothetical protein
MTQITIVHHLAMGQCHQLWWAWERDGLSMVLKFVTMDSFDFYQVGGPRWRKSLAERRSRRKADRQHRETWGGLEADESAGRSFPPLRRRRRPPASLN